MSKSKTIKIFLYSGEPTGIRIVEMNNRTIKGFVVPRNKLKEILDREELSSQAVYFLLGESETGKEKVYVGEAEDFSKRIRQHEKGKEFWSLALCFISKDENLTKAHVKFLETELIKQINLAKRIELENGNGGAVPKLPESDEATMIEFLEDLKILLTSLGFLFLEDLSVKDEAEEEVYFVKGRGVGGKVKLSNEGYVVQKESVIAGEDVPSFSGSALSTLRYQVYTSDRVERLSNGNYKLLENMIFSSPTYAASFILGRSTNGWTKLKNKEGKTLNELKRK